MRRKAFHHLRQERAIFITHRREFHSHSVPRLRMPHNSVGADRAFLDKKVKLQHHVHRPHLVGLEKQASCTQVCDSCSIVTSFTTPVDPSPLGCFDSLVVSSPRGRSLLHNVINGMHNPSPKIQPTPQRRCACATALDSLDIQTGAEQNKQSSGGVRACRTPIPVERRCCSLWVTVVKPNNCPSRVCPRLYVHLDDTIPDGRKTAFYIQ